jgi:two-component system OmpR family response regulator
VVLPDADGFDILARVRQHPVLKEVPVLLLTGRATREAVLQGLTLGADGYLTKPFEPDALLHAVRTVLGLPDEDVRKAWGGPQR